VIVNDAAPFILNTPRTLPTRSTTAMVALAFPRLRLGHCLGNHAFNIGDHEEVLAAGEGGVTALSLLSPPHAVNAHNVSSAAIEARRLMGTRGNARTPTWCKARMRHDARCLAWPDGRVARWSYGHGCRLPDVPCRTCARCREVQVRLLLFAKTVARVAAPMVA
jgi:hypothetical protein